MVNEYLLNVVNQEQIDLAIVNSVGHDIRFGKWKLLIDVDDFLKFMDFWMTDLSWELRYIESTLFKSYVECEK